MDGTGFEDPSRAALAAWRFSTAPPISRADCSTRRRSAEYRRGLSVDPYANQGRRRYAELLRGSKLPTSYLSELRFLADLGKADQALSDAMEIYDSLLEGSVSRDWKVDGASLASSPYRIAVFSVGPGGTPYHAGSDMVVARYLRDALAFEPGLAPERGSPRACRASPTPSGWRGNRAPTGSCSSASPRASGTSSCRPSSGRPGRARSRPG